MSTDGDKALEKITCWLTVLEIKSQTHTPPRAELTWLS